MPTQLQFRRGNTAQTAVFTGAVAEITVDTDKNTIVVHDGVTAGGWPAPQLSFVQNSFNKANAANTLAQSAFDVANTKYNSSGGTIGGNVDVTGNVLPTSSNVFSLGSNSYRWKDLFVSSGSIYIGDIVLSNTGGILTISGASDLVVVGANTPSVGYVSVTANAAFNQANAAGATAQSAFNQANTANTTAQAGFDKANTVDVYAQAGFSQANAAGATAQSAFTQANTSGATAQSAFNQANTADATAQAAFNNSNTKFSTSGGLITGDTSITGNLTVNGNFSTVNTSVIQVTDSMIALAVNNSTDIVDIGFYGHYTNANTVNVHTGLVRDASDKIYYLFDELTGEPGSTVDVANSRIATVNANIISQSVTVSGFNILNYTTSAYNQANLASTTAQSAFTQANTANTTAQAGFDQANTAGATAQSAFTQANTANTTAQAGFDQANTAGATAQSAFTQANTDFTNISIAGGTFGNTTTIPTVTVEANGRVSGISSVSFTAGASLADDTSTNADYFPIFATANTGTPTTIYVSSTKLLYNPSSGTITAVDLNTTSDIKYKENIEPIESAINILKNVNGVSFNWKETGSKSYGVVAQELEKVLPELVHSTERGLSVSYLPLIAILIEAVKEQQKQIDELKNKQ